MTIKPVIANGLPYKVVLLCVGDPLLRLVFAEKTYEQLGGLSCQPEFPIVLGFLSPYN